MCIYDDGKMNYDEFDDCICNSKVVKLKLPKHVLKKMFICDRLHDRYERIMVILFCKKVVLNRRNYLEIVAIDIFSGKIVKIVDTNGMCYDLHTYSEEFASLGEHSVIKASFKIANSLTSINCFRITSCFECIGETDVHSVIYKLYNTYNVHLTKDVREIENFYEKFKLSFYTFTFVDSEIERSKNNGYKIVFNGRFISIDESIVSDLKENDNYFKGRILLEVNNDKRSVVARMLIGDFQSKHERWLQKQEEYCQPFGEKLKESSVKSTIKSSEFEKRLSVNDLLLHIKYPGKYKKAPINYKMQYMPNRYVIDDIYNDYFPIDFSMMDYNEKYNIDNYIGAGTIMYYEPARSTCEVLKLKDDYIRIRILSGEMTDEVVDIHGSAMGMELYFDESEVGTSIDKLREQIRYSFEYYKDFKSLKGRKNDA